MVKFRRNYERIGFGGFGRRAIVLLLAAIGICGFLVYIATQIKFYKPAATAILKVNILNENRYIIQKDTTNYEKFASVLRRKVKKLKEQDRPVKILLQLPKSAKVGQVADILMIANAFEGVKMEVQAER